MAGGRLSLWLLHGLLGAAFAHAQQVCDPAVPAPSSPSSRFSDEGEGTVTDQRTQLMWMRCAAGQAWQGGGCTGSPARVSWTAGQGWADQVNQAGSHFFNDWRLPSVRELATLTERQCTHPRINLSIFPATPAASFWTRTGRIGQDGDVYVLDFAAGGVGHAAKQAEHHLRLVRNAP